MTNETVFARTRPWLLSAVAGAAVPFALLFLVSAFPGLRGYGPLARPPFFVPYLFLHHSPLEGLAYTGTVLATGVFLGLGAALTVKASVGPTGNYRKRSRFFIFRSVSAQALLVSALASLFIIIPLLSAVWSIAVDTHHVPRVWFEFEGNHGPWRYAHGLRKLINWMILMPLISIAFAALSFILRPRIYTFVVVSVGVVALFFLFATHYWLID